MKLDMKFIKFGFVGSMGAIINIVIYKLFINIFPSNFTMAAIIAFLFAVSFNYTINHLWTFKSLVGSKLSMHLYLKYITINLVGLGINLITLNSFIHLWGADNNLIGQCLGILLGMISNFLFSKYFVFTKKETIDE